MPEIKIIIAVKNEDALKRYLAELKPFDVELEVVGSLRELHSKLIANPFNGILIDFPTKVLSSTEEKELMQVPLQIFPVMLLRWEKADNSVRALAQFEGKEVVTVAEYITVICTSFKARSIRSSPRYEIHLNVLIKVPFQNEPSKAIAQNVSLGGCFIITSEMLQGEKKCMCQFVEIDKDRWFEAEIRWRAPWGKGTRYPGIGIKFPDEPWIQEKLQLLLQ